MNNDTHKIHTNASNDLCDFQREVSFENRDRLAHRVGRKDPLQTVRCLFDLVDASGSTGHRWGGEQKAKVVPYRGFRSICLQVSPPHLLTTWKCLLCNSNKVVRPSTCGSSNSTAIWKMFLLFLANLPSIHATTLFPITASQWGGPVSEAGTLARKWGADIN